MKRFISNFDPDLITKDFLYSLDWDILELPFTVDLKELNDWYNTVTETYKDLEFTFIDNPYIKDEFSVSDTTGYGYANKISGVVSSWGLDWPAETDLPIPPPFAAKLEYYPELLTTNPYLIQKKYKFGYFERLCNRLGDEAFRFSRITKHYTGAKIGQHIDGKNSLRIHIPIIASEQSKFLYGDELEREYSFVPGKVYLINACVLHATNNAGEPRAHIISDPPLDKILELVRITGQV